MTDLVTATGTTVALLSQEILVLAVVVALGLVAFAAGLWLWTALDKRPGPVLGLPGPLPAPPRPPDDPRRVPVIFYEENGKRLLRWGELVVADEA